MNVSATDKNFTSPYRYHYNSMEMDAEVSGSGNSYTTEFRQYDPRLGRWKSLDPLMAQFPWMSPYVAFNNNPVFFIDPLGLEGGPPSGLPENPCNEDIATADNGKRYQWVENNEGKGSWSSYNGNIEVVGQGNKGPTAYQGAVLCQDSYKSKSSEDLSGGWYESKDLPKGVQLKKESEGYKSRLYQREYNGKIQYAYVFAGTDEMKKGGWKDWQNNIFQVISESRQYKRAVKNAKRLSKAIEGELTFVGHSLGGGLASAAAGATGQKAVVYNPAWLSNRTIRKNDLDFSNTKVDSYVVMGEILNYLQTCTPQLELNCNYLNTNLLIDFNLINKMENSWDLYLFGVPTGGVMESMVNAHGIEMVLKLLSL